MIQHWFPEFWPLWGSGAGPSSNRKNDFWAKLLIEKLILMVHVTWKTAAPVPNLMKHPNDHTYISYRRQPGLEICGCAAGEVWLSKKRGVAQLCSSILLYWNRFLLLWTSKQTNLQYKYLFHKLSLPLQVVTYFWLLRRWAHRIDSNWVCWILNRLMRYTSSDRVIWVHLILITHI